MGEEMIFPWPAEALQRVDPKATGEPIAWAKEEEPPPRQAFERRAKRHYNDRQEFCPHVVDAGELGILWLWQESGRWESRWIELEHIPAAAAERVGEKREGER